MLRNLFGKVVTFILSILRIGSIMRNGEAKDQRWSLKSYDNWYRNRFPRIVERIEECDVVGLAG